MARVPKLLYFHENQLAYPVRNAASAERDHHFGFTQLGSALAADRCVFNSEWNQASFLDAGRALLRRMPDAVPADWIDRIAAHSQVLGLPLDLPELTPPTEAPMSNRTKGPILLWNHRWEHDKNPERFFRVLFALQDAAVPFRLAVCGERYQTAPPIFDEARQRLNRRIVHWGWLSTRDEYWKLLQRAHLAVSTATHEFFGLSVLEAIHAGAQPLVPDALAYPEIIPDCYRYRDETDLRSRLAAACHDHTSGNITLREDRRAIVQPFAAVELLPHYATLMASLVPGRPIPEIRGPATP